MLIKLYGEYWNPDAVEWGTRGAGNNGQLLGLLDGHGKKALDFWDSRGVYALHDDFRVVYIGQALDQPLGKRIRDHLTDRLAGRWDMFSWYSLSTFREKNVRKPGQRQTTPADVIDTLEALGIGLTLPPLNRRYNKIPGARRVEQAKSPHPHTERHYLEEILKRLPELVTKANGKSKK